MTMQKQVTQKIKWTPGIWEDVLLDYFVTHLNLCVSKHFIVGDKSKPNAVWNETSGYRDIAFLNRVFLRENECTSLLRGTTFE